MLERTHSRYLSMRTSLNVLHELHVYVCACMCVCMHVCVFIVSYNLKGYLEWDIIIVYLLAI